VAGDLSHVEEAPGILVPGLAAVALQQGELVSENILLDLDSRDRKAFHYKDKGMIATIGHKRAIFESGRIQFGGLAAWLAWLAVHLFFLISFKNRIAVLYLWTWSYLFSKRGSRLITSTDWKLDKTESLPAVNERKTG
jgi:NADH dehydrogenase